MRSWIKSLVTYVKAMAGIADPFYPEMLSTICFTRAPSMFGATWKVTKVFLAERTVEKVKVLSSKPLPTLLKIMPVESIPIVLGGTNGTFVGIGGPVPNGALSDKKYLASVAEAAQIGRLGGQAPAGGGGGGAGRGGRKGGGGGGGGKGNEISVQLSPEAGLPDPDPRKAAMTKSVAAAKHAKATKNDNISPKEQAALDELKRMISETPASLPNRRWLVNCGELTMLRYIRGHKLNVKTAFKMITDTAKWRQEYKTDDVVTNWANDTSPEATLIKGYMPLAVLGFDFRGRAVQINKMSAIDFPGLLREVGLERMVYHNVAVIEESLMDNPLGEAIFIIDLGTEDLPDAPIQRLTDISKWVNGLLAFVKKMASINDPHYPETFYRIFFTRTPGMFQSVWKIAKAFMNERTVEKVIVVPQKETFKVLSEYMDASVIPHYFGGQHKMEGIGPGGRLPSNALKNAEFMAKMQERVDLASGRGGADASQSAGGDPAEGDYYAKGGRTRSVGQLVCRSFARIAQATQPRGRHCRGDVTRQHFRNGPPIGGSQDARILEVHAGPRVPRERQRRGTCDQAQRV